MDISFVIFYEHVQHRSISTTLAFSSVIFLNELLFTLFIHVKLTYHFSGKKNLSIFLTDDKQKVPTIIYINNLIIEFRISKVHACVNLNTKDLIKYFFIHKKSTWESMKNLILSHHIRKLSYLCAMIKVSKVTGMRKSCNIQSLKHDIKSHWDLSRQQNQPLSLWREGLRLRGHIKF